jgi:hypothetical protein
MALPNPTVVGGRIHRMGLKEEALDSLRRREEDKRRMERAVIRDVLGSPSGKGGSMILNNDDGTYNVDGYTFKVTQPYKESSPTLYVIGTDGQHLPVTSLAQLGTLFDEGKV